MWATPTVPRAAAPPHVCRAVWPAAPSAVVYDACIWCHAPTSACPYFPTSLPLLPCHQHFPNNHHRFRCLTLTQVQSPHMPAPASAFQPPLYTPQASGPGAPIPQDRVPIAWTSAHGNAPTGNRDGGGALTWSDMCPGIRHRLRAVPATFIASTSEGKAPSPPPPPQGEREHIPPPHPPSLTENPM